MNTKIIGNKIIEARKKLNISQAQLAEKIFISPQAVGKWERGESIPDIITFNKLAEILGVDLNYFSENFQSISTEIHSDILQKQNKKNKFLWDMSRGNWIDADFSGLKNLQEKFSSSNIKNCKFINSDISGLLFKNNNIDTCNFSNSNMNKIEMKNNNLSKNLLKKCLMENTIFIKNNIENCDFSDSIMNKSLFEKSNIDKSFFKYSLLKEVNFLKSYIQDCDFFNTDFSNTIFKNSGFQNNKLLDTKLNQTSFINSEISKITFYGKLDNCYFDNCYFDNVVFQNTIIINTFFKSNNIKKIKFINCHVDRITYEFLKSEGVDVKNLELIQ